MTPPFPDLSNLMVLLLSDQTQTFQILLMSGKRWRLRKYIRRVACRLDIFKGDGFFALIVSRVL